MGMDLTLNNIQGTYTKVDMVQEGQQANDRPMIDQNVLIRETEEADRQKDETITNTQETEESKVTEDGGESGRSQPFLLIRKKREKKEEEEEGLDNNHILDITV